MSPAAMRILVTGGAGFIGAGIVDGYAAAGHEVIVVDDLSTGSGANVNPTARWYPVDIRSRELNDVFAAERPEVVSHHAAQTDVRRSVDDPAGDASVNVLGSINVLEAARAHGTRRLILASTAAVYGEAAPIPTGEAYRGRPLNPYAVGKLAAEHYVRHYAAHGLPAVILRYANVYGPRQDPRGEAGVVAIFIQRALAGLPPTIHGDGEQTRDFVYVDDVVRANLAALELPAPPRHVPTLNVATGRGTGINALWSAVAALGQSPLTPQHEPVRPEDIRHSVLDPVRARRALGWRAEVDLATGLRRTWDWFRTAGARAAAAA